MQTTLNAAMMIRPNIVGRWHSIYRAVSASSGYRRARGRVSAKTSLGYGWRPNRQATPVVTITVSDAGYGPSLKRRSPMVTGLAG